MVMTFIPPDQEAELRTFLRERLRAPVMLDLLLGGPSDASARSLVGELAPLSPKLTVRVHEGAPEPPLAAGIAADERPAIVLSGAASGRVRFLGSPVGLEFPTLLRSLIDVARGDTTLAEPTKRALRALARDVHIRVFVTPTCPFCPSVAHIAHQVAVQSARVTADVVEAQELRALGRRYAVEGVPTVVVNGRTEFVGAPSGAGFLARVLRAGAPA